ncbi:hypothetical protein H0N96_00770 [Candidatus Micrarchaeota archaeon]|nr:hypothetical protein [Candidatus Micrarchaeota archaeon]
MKKLGAFVLLCSIVFSIALMGCTQQPPAVATPSPVPTEVTPSPIPSPTPASLTPLKLEYEFKQSGGPSQDSSASQTTLYFTLWLNEEKDCNGKNAFLGLIKASDKPNQPDDQSSWVKMVVYADDGVMAVSKNGNKNELAFDNAKSAALDFDFFLTLNSLFAAAGKNFNTDPVWNSTVPVILKNVVFSGNPVNFSVIKGDDSSEFALPCKKFSLISQEQGGGPSELSVCVAKPGGKLPLPFVVSMTIGENFDVKLKSVSKEKASVPYYPQCLTPVTCQSVSRPSAADDQACRNRTGNFEQVRDVENCIVSYACKTERERVLDDLQRSQRSGCPQPSEALIQKAIDCSSKNNRQYHSGNDGCINDVTC